MSRSQAAHSLEDLNPSDIKPIDGSATVSFQKPSPGFSITMRLQLENQPGNFSKVTALIANEMASLAEVSMLSSDFKYVLRDITVLCMSESHAQQIVYLIQKLSGIRLIEWHDDTFEMHRGGKLVVQATMPITSRAQLARAYTPGVARVCTAIANNSSKAYDYTIKGNCVAVISDGTAVLGLGDIGPFAAMPVMEGKAMIFREFAGINAFPICLNTKDPDRIIETVKMIAPGFGGINLEDIAAPGCFEIEERLRAELDIPVFHDDQHGTAVVVLAGLLNAMKIVGKKLSELKVVVNGFGAGGVACTRILLSAGVRNIIACDTAGIVYRGRTERMNSIKESVVAQTNPDNIKGSVGDALRGADVFIGVSGPRTIDRAMVQSMARDAIVFALANPIPEILPDEISDLARITATGRSDYANQVNNALCFPGIFRGALDCRARTIDDSMKVAAAQAIAESISDTELREDCIIPCLFDRSVPQRVAQRVQEAARRAGLARSDSGFAYCAESPNLS